MTLRTLISVLIIFQLNSFHTLAQSGQSTVRTGEFEINGTSESILGSKTAEAYSKVIKADKKVTWNVYVPEKYDPTQPAGVVVYYSTLYPNQIQSSWKTGSKEKNLIWISIKGSRNFTERRKMFLGVLAPTLLQEKYAINANRIYTTGDRSGCVSASNVAKIYSNIFTGAIYNSCEPETWRKETPEGIEYMKRGRYVFITSRRNENRVDVRRAEAKYNNAGVENTLLKTYSTLEEDVKLTAQQVMELINFLDGVQTSG